jgi:cytochrome c-type biogenesis protein CcmH
MENLGFWAMAAAMATAVAAILLLAARREGTARAEASATQLYRDQLAEVDRDVARGTLAQVEADRLRTEIGRRLLEADRAQGTTGPARTGSPLPAMAVIVAGVAGSVGLYALWGAPGYPDLPLRDRLAMADAMMAQRPDQASAAASAPAVQPPPAPDAAFLDLMDKLRDTLKSRPNDVTGLALLARNEAALGNLAAAEAAQRQLITARGDAVTADDYAGLAEVMIRAAGGYVSPEAEAVLVQALQLDPKDGAARYFSGLMFAQGGRYDRAFALWRGLIDEGPDDAPWIAPIRAQMPEVAFRAGVNYELPPEKGPSADDIAAAAEMSPEDRQAMIEGMVAQLSERLASEGGPAEDWAKLIRALGVLKDTEQAKAIYSEAQTRFAGDAAALSFLKEAALEAGLTP